MSAIIDAPPSTTPPPAIEAPAKGGIDSMMAQLDRGVAVSNKPIPEPAKPAAVAPKPEATKTATEAPKEAAKPTETATTAKPESGPEADWSKAPPKWYKIYEGHKAKTGETIKSLEAKIKALETKPVESKGDSEKLAALEKQLEAVQGETKTYKQRLAEVDFTKTPEYKAQFVDRANRIWAKGVELVKQLSVTDSKGNERAGTQSDFDTLRTLPEHLREDAALEMFGTKSRAVLKYIDSIDMVRDEADTAAQHHAQTHEQTAIQREMQSKRGQQEFDGHFKSSLEAIKSDPEFGKWFSPNADDPEASKLLQDGYDEIEKVTKQMDAMPADQQAHHAALFRARAAAMPRMMLEYNRVTAELEAVKEELEKIRGTDPGAKTKTETEAPKKEAPKGINAFAEAFNVTG